MRIDIALTSEIDRLEAVVTSPPGREFDLMVPENLERFRRDEMGTPVRNPDDLLFDDLVLLSAMQEEHARLADVIRAVTGDDGHFTFRDLLSGSLYAPEVRSSVVDEVVDLERRLYRIPAAELDASREILGSLEATHLAEALFTGRAPLDSRRLLRWPMPNALFARDLAAAAGRAVVISHAAEPARGREMCLARTVFEHHPFFRGTRRLDVAGGGPAHPGTTIEGGDLQFVDRRVVVVGIGLRTTSEAVRGLAPLLFDQGFEVVLACEIPRNRGAMHLDTLFTRIDEGRCLVYPPLISNPAALGIRVHRMTRDGTSDAGRDLLAALCGAGIDLAPVLCGGADPVRQAREQWSDGANAFALAPGIIVCYARNEATLVELNRAGYEVVDPGRFVRNATLYLAEGRRLAIALTGHELSRGRGGPRCLTLPLRRASSGGSR